MKWFFVITLIGILLAVYKAKAVALRHALNFNQLSGFVVRERQTRFWTKLMFIYAMLVLVAIGIYVQFNHNDPVPIWWALAQGCFVGFILDLFIVMGVAVAVIHRNPATQCHDIVRTAWMLAWPAVISAACLIFEEAGNTLMMMVAIIAGIISVFT
jgi:hypothetical protein